VRDGSQHLTVVANSMRIADVLTARRTNVILTGGSRTPSDALVGSITVAAVGIVLAGRTRSASPGADPLADGVPR
jgi:hypothetical protein